MRLTLRNLLRFLDQTDLRSAERKRLQELVEKSEKAGPWIERIESLRRNPQIAPPPLDDKDAMEINKVAVYLDMKMNEKETANFERDLLNNDELLAEVAACHKIKCNLVRSQSPHVPIELRQSIYDLDRTIKSTGEQQVNGEDSIIGLVANMEDLPFKDGSVEEDQYVGGRPSAKNGLEDHDDDSVYVPIEKLSQKARRKSVVSTIILFSGIVGLIGLAFWMGRQSVAVPGGGDNALTSAEDPKKGTDSNNNKIVGKSDEDSDKPDTAEPTDLTKQKGLQGAVDHPRPLDIGDPGDNQSEQVASNELPDRPMIDVSSWKEAGDEKVTAQAAPVEIGKFSSPNKLMLILPSGGEDWIRATPDSTIYSGSELLVLRDQVASITLGETINLFLIGPVRISILHPSDDGLPAISISYGRLEIQPKAVDSDLSVQIGDTKGVISIPVAGAAIYLERAFYLAPGSDPREKKPIEYRTVYCRNERCDWTVADQVVPLSPQNVWIQIDQATPRVGTLNGPMAFEQLQLPDGFADSQFAELFINEKKIIDQIIELTGNNRKEYRTEAIGGLAAAGNFAFLVDFLNDDRNRSEWRNVIGLVRFYLANDSSAANQIYADLAQAGNRQNKIFELILGYSQDQLAAGKDAQLVELLDDSELAMRVLAIDNLRSVTDGLTFSYRAESPGIIRRRHIKNWTRKLEKNTIRYASLPEPPHVDIVGLPLPDSDNKNEDDQNNQSKTDGG